MAIVRYDTGDDLQITKEGVGVPLQTRAEVHLWPLRIGTIQVVTGEDGRQVTVVFVDQAWPKNNVSLLITGDNLQVTLKTDR